MVRDGRGPAGVGRVGDVGVSGRPSVKAPRPAGSLAASCAATGMGVLACSCALGDVAMAAYGCALLAFALGSLGRP